MNEHKYSTLNLIINAAIAVGTLAVAITAYHSTKVALDISRTAEMRRTDDKLEISFNILTKNIKTGKYVDKKSAWDSFPEPTFAGEYLEIIFDNKGYQMARITSIKFESRCGSYKTTGYNILPYIDDETSSTIIAAADRGSFSFCIDRTCKKIYLPQFSINSQDCKHFLIANTVFNKYEYIIPDDMASKIGKW